MNNIEFSKNLIKGKIAETVFEQMFRERGGFTILKSGYEYALPEVAQYQKYLGEIGKKVKDDISHTPDFVLISDDKKELYLVEVKYRSERHKEQIKEIAEKTLKGFDPSWLFIASPDGFYFEPCHSIVNANGEIQRMSESIIKKEIQDKYLKLLNEFEK